jgi:hypothetical protein
MKLSRWISGLPDRSLSVRVAALTAVMAAAYGCALCAAVGSGGQAGIVAASLAGGVCLASAAAALVISHLLRAPAKGVAAILLPMAVRTGLPLLVVLIVRSGGQGLVEAGLAYYLMGFYLLALAVEIPMSLPRAARPRQCSAESTAEGWKPHG